MSSCQGIQQLNEGLRKYKPRLMSENLYGGGICDKPYYLIDRYYVYSLIINNATIDTKLMLISYN